MHVCRGKYPIVAILGDVQQLLCIRPQRCSLTVWSRWSVTIAHLAAMKVWRYHWNALCAYIVVHRNGRAVIFSVQCNWLTQQTVSIILGTLAVLSWSDDAMATVSLSVCVCNYNWLPHQCRCYEWESVHALSLHFCFSCVLTREVIN